MPVGSFQYRNKSAGQQLIGGVVITVTDPGILASLTVTLDSTGQSASVAPVAASNTLIFDPPIAIEDGQTLSFSMTARTIGGDAAIMADSVAYASMLSGRGQRLAPLGGGLLLLGAMLMPMGIRRRRRVAWMALAALVLIATMAGCGNSGATPATITRQVEAGGELTRPVKLSVVKVKSSNSSSTTTQVLTAIVFNG